MRQNKKETTPATRKKRFGTKWLLVLYDLLLLFMVDVVLLVLYKGMEGLEPMDIVVQGITAAACIFFMRWFWKVYSQVWRYGGIQSYIRLLVSDGCAFLLYYLVEQFLPVRHISFARVLCISCLSLLGSLTIRMVYRYAYKCREYIFGSDSVGSIHGLRANSVFLWQYRTNPDKRHQSLYFCDIIGTWINR